MSWYCRLAELKVPRMTGRFYFSSCMTTYRIVTRQLLMYDHGAQHGDQASRVRAVLAELKLCASIHNLANRFGVISLFTRKTTRRDQTVVDFVKVFGSSAVEIASTKGLDF